ncbi:protease complex subunit PrcB family protein [Arhodomonas sp. AD133]|uniref:protease complex subunit PrcB family protein n=1 Tax=Arhodomonas sp. AD133 TaxID=3415009 RepID=UPI003EB93DAE
MRHGVWLLAVALGLVACRAQEPALDQALTVEPMTLARSARCAPGDARVRWFDDADALVAGTGSLVDAGTADGLDWRSQAAVGVWLGERPTAGYGLSLADSRQQGDRLELVVRRQTPPADAMVAQVITYPCLIVTVPRTGYSTLQVVDDDGANLGRLRPGVE